MAMAKVPTSRNSRVVPQMLSTSGYLAALGMTWLGNSLVIDCSLPFIYWYCRSNIDQSIITQYQSY